MLPPHRRVGGLLLMLVPFPLVLLLLLPVMVHLVLLFGSNGGVFIRRPAVAGRERST